MCRDIELALTDQRVSRSRPLVAVRLRSPSMCSRMRCAVLLLAIVLALSGCGSGGDESEPLSSAEYQEAITAIVRDSAQANDLFTDLVVSEQPQPRCEELIGAFREEVAMLIEHVAAIQPPPELAAIQDEFIASARNSVAQIELAEAEVEMDDLCCGRQLNDALYRMPSSVRAEAAISQLEAEGYVVFGR